MTKNIAVVCGGNSGEYAISIGSATMVSKHLDPVKFTAYLIVVKEKDWFYEMNGNKYPVDKNDFSVTVEGEKINFQGVFNAIHGTPGEDGKLQGYFDLMGIPYTSCNVATSSLTFNKFYCNRFVSTYGIATANSVSFVKSQLIDKTKVVETLGLPLFVKPAESGSSVGISKVNTEDEFEEAIELAFTVSDRIIIEEFIKGRELACGIINRGNELIVFPLTEIISKKDFFDYEAKYTHGMADEITPAEIDDDLEMDIKAISSNLYRDLDCKGFVRFDYIVTNTDLYFLEVNTIPGISEASIMPKMAEAYGLSFKEFINMATENLFL